MRRLGEILDEVVPVVCGDVSDPIMELYRNAGPTQRRSMERQGLVGAPKVPQNCPESAPDDAQKRAGAPIARASCALDEHEQEDPRNATEIRYEQEILWPLVEAGEVLRYEFEPLKFWLAKATYYTPDYLVVMADGRMVFHEVKGRKGTGPGGWRDDARVKIKVAADLYGELFGFVAACKIPKKQGGGWDVEVLA